MSPKYQMIRMENMLQINPEEQYHMLNVFSGQLMWRKGPGYWVKWKTHCVLYCILLSTGFTVRRLYYVSILFYYASVFDFPKYKKFYMALCVAEKYFLPWSIRIALQKQTNPDVKLVEY